MRSVWFLAGATALSAIAAGHAFLASESSPSIGNTKQEQVLRVVGNASGEKWFTRSDDVVHPPYGKGNGEEPPALSEEVFYEAGNPPETGVVNIDSPILDGPYGFDPENGVETEVVVYPAELICGQHPDLDCDVASSDLANEPHQITQDSCIAPCEDGRDGDNSVVIVRLDSDPFADFNRENFSPGTTERVIIQQPIYQNEG